MLGTTSIKDLRQVMGEITNPQELQVALYEAGAYEIQQGGMGGGGKKMFKVWTELQTNSWKSWKVGGGGEWLGGGLDKMLFLSSQ